MMRTISTLLLLASFWALPNAIWAQAASDSLPQTPSDSLQPIVQLDSPKVVKKSAKHSPKKALLFGLIPGGGQIYNRKYWKLPIVYAGMGALGYWGINSYQQYRCHRDAYLALTDDDPDTNATCEIPGLSNPTASDYNAYRQRYRSQYETAFLSLAGFYLLTLADAYVDAHLMEFDINDDLSLQWQPQLAPQGQNWAGGVHLRLLPRQKLRSKPRLLP